MQKIVYLATTKGCEACKIMERILNKVYRDNLYTFSVNILDYKELPEFIKVNVLLNDFPTVIFVSNNVIKYHFSGTIPAVKLQSIICDLGFN